jgi:hypothetical protein
MGTRSAPTIANIFMGAIERKILNQSPLSLHIFDQFWRRFIDDMDRFRNTVERISYIHQLSSSHN